MVRAAVLFCFRGRILCFIRMAGKEQVLQEVLHMNNERTVTNESLMRFEKFLREEERSPGTIEKYLRDVRMFSGWLAGYPITKELTLAWKDELLQSGRAPSTVNSMLAAVNSFFHFMGWQELHLKAIRLQRSFFRSNGRELTREEYEKLVEAACRKGDEQLALLMETICATGIRVSELRYITMEATKNGKTQISMKGKFRTILLPSQLCRKLKKYAVKNGIKKGEIFLNAKGNSLDRRWIWAKMKALCRFADISKEKVFPHNLRHLFARCFYRASRDLSALADMLGHSSIETTRIYLVSTEEIYAKKIARLGLVRQTK